MRYSSEGRLNAGFVGFDGTENKRTILALNEVKDYEGLKGNINLLLRKPHGRAKSIVEKIYRLCSDNLAYDVYVYVSDDGDRTKWHDYLRRYDIGVEGGYDAFFSDSGFVMIGVPGDEEGPYVKSGLEHECFISLMGGADRPALQRYLTDNGVKLNDEQKADLGREFFFGLENYELFQKAQPSLVQCTSCNTTGLSRMALAARPLGLYGVIGNIDRRHGDPHTVVKASPSAIQFGQGAGHQGAGAQTIFEDVEFSVRASKVPTTMPHTNFLSLIFEGEVTPEQLRDQLAKTREIVVIPYKDEGKKHEWTSEILEAFLSGVERPISPTVYELLVSDAIIPFELKGDTILQTVSMVEQMSIAVPNHVESYLLANGYPADEVHKTVDKALDVLHGIWPDKLSF